MQHSLRTDPCSGMAALSEELHPPPSSGRLAAKDAPELVVLLRSEGEVRVQGLGCGGHIQETHTMSHYRSSKHLTVIGQH